MFLNMQGKNKHFSKNNPGRIRTTKHLTTYLPGIHHRPVITVSTDLLLLEFLKNFSVAILIYTKSV